MKNYSFNALAACISEHSFEQEIINLRKQQYYFTNGDAEVSGTIRGYFEIQKQTYENPPFCDLKDAMVEIYSVVINSENSEKIFTLKERMELAKKIKNLMI